MFREGDAVWCPMFGWGKVVEVGDGRGTYPVKVNFGSFNEPNIEDFTMEGKYTSLHKKPILFFEEVKMPKMKKQLPKLKRDDLIEYQENGKTRKAYVCGEHPKDKSITYIYTEGRTSKTFVYTEAIDRKYITKVNEVEV